MPSALYGNEKESLISLICSESGRREDVFRKVGEDGLFLKAASMYLSNLPSLLGPYWGEA